MKMRLIDADDLKKTWYKEHNIEPGESGAMFVGNNEVPKFIDRARTIDAVPVVRCKDCRWYVRSMIKQDGTLDERYKPDWCDLYRRVREETYFCADGERKDDDD